MNTETLSEQSVCTVSITFSGRKSFAKSNYQRYRKITIIIPYYQVICSKGLFSGGLIFGRGRGGIAGGSFALQKWFSLYLEGILRLKMSDFASGNAVPEGT